MSTKSRESKSIYEIYKLSVKLYYELGDYEMLHRAHPGIPGPPGDGEEWSPDRAMVEGTIETLRQVLNVIE